MSQLRLLVDERLLGRYLGEERCRALLPARGVRSLGFDRTSRAAEAGAAAIGRSLASGTTDVLDLQIHALSLLAEQLRRFRSSPPPCARITPQDLDRIERARDLMREQMDRPLTIGYLCTTVGLSEFKLKQGFQQAFGVPPHRLLLEMRMRRAQALLEGGCQVAQAGWQVGYAHPPNFSAAFRKFFGRSPRSVGTR